VEEDLQVETTLYLLLLPQQVVVLEEEQVNHRLVLEVLEAVALVNTRVVQITQPVVQVTHLAHLQVKETMVVTAAALNMLVAVAVAQELLVVQVLMNMEVMVETAQLLVLQDQLLQEVAVAVEWELQLQVAEDLAAAVTAAAVEQIQEQLIQVAVEEQLDFIKMHLQVVQE
tara:strand:+ start:49 stop:561 length:513 start_codon:yes stop_codon:yes gene_type:complete